MSSMAANTYLKRQARKDNMYILFKQCIVSIRLQDLAAIDSARDAMRKFREIVEPKGMVCGERATMDDWLVYVSLADCPNVAAGHLPAANTRLQPRLLDERTVDAGDIALVQYLGRRKLPA